MSVRILVGDCRDVLRTLPAESVHCVVTSPPYYGLRDYGVAGQIGLEPSLPDFIAELVDVFRAVRRVLRRDGTCWVNLGDSYANVTGSQGVRVTKSDDPSWHGGALLNHPKRQQTTDGVRAAGLKPKDMMGVPWRVALALQADGWWLRSDIIWHKTNPMPESVTDRPTRAHEYLFLLTRAERYHYDAGAIVEPVSPNTHARLAQDVANQVGSARANGGAKTNGNMKAVGRTPKTLPTRDQSVKNNESFASATCLPVECRNKRTVWATSTEAFSEAHFATFPPALIEPCIKAGCPRGGGGGARPFWRRRHHRPRRRSPATRRHPDRVESRLRRHGRAPHPERRRHADRRARRALRGGAR